ncbi:MAG: hypothetical protein CM15mV26_0160 [uncultured marine virus]|nr:MAG: hypothetical protein CM15mV26_0160 [uncultured marine virus]
MKKFPGLKIFKTNLKFFLQKRVLNGGENAEFGGSILLATPGIEDFFGKFIFLRISGNFDPKNIFTVEVGGKTQLKLSIFKKKNLV